MKLRQNHEAERIVIKKANIDKKMVPAVRWLNSFRWVWTRWCCEGYEDPDRQDPYIAFYCEDSRDLVNIIQTIDPMYGKIDLNFYKENQSIRYKINFTSVKDLDRFTTDLEKEERFIIWGEDRDLNGEQ